MRAIEKKNTTLKNVLPKNYASPDLDKRVLGEVVDLFTNMDMGDTEESKELLGRHTSIVFSSLQHTRVLKAASSILLQVSLKQSLLF